MEAALLEPIPCDVRPHSVVLIETDRWLVGVPLSMHAMYWWGGFTKWCTAWEPCYFESYTKHGPLIVFRARESSARWALHAVSGEFRDVRNAEVSWRGFLMRSPELAGGMMDAIATIIVSRTETLAPLLHSLRLLNELATLEAKFLPEAREALLNVDRSLSAVPSWMFQDDGSPEDDCP